MFTTLPSLKYCDMLLLNPHVILEGNEVDCYKSLGTFRGYDPFLDPYRLYLEGMPGKIMLIFAFDYSADFSKAFDKFRRALVNFLRFIFECFYLHLSELHAQVFDKLL